MTVQMVLAVALAGAAGAAARYAVTRFAQAYLHSSAAWGTVIVNISGSFALGLLLGLAISTDIANGLVIVLGAGFLGAYTTFSTWMYETVRLIEQRAWKTALVNIIAPLIAGPAVAAIAFWLTVRH